MEVEMVLSSSAGLSDRIRAYVDRTYISSSRESGRSCVIIRAGDVHSKMGLRDRMPAVCSALRSKKLEQSSGVELIRQTGPHQGANAFFELRIREAVAREEAASPAPRGAEERDAPAAPQPIAAAAQSGSVVLISCVARKRAEPAPAKDLYLSDWFLKARRYAESTGCPWFILSAEHGLVSPDAVIEPYDRTLNTMSAYDRRVWGERTLAQVISAVPDARRVVLLAGARYREHLADALRQRGITVEIPMENLRIGEQLAWLDANAIGSKRPAGARISRRWSWRS